MSHTVLLVDADQPTTAVLAEQLAADGYRAVGAHSIDAVHAVAAPAAPDVVVLGDLGEQTIKSIELFAAYVMSALQRRAGDAMAVV